MRMTTRPRRGEVRAVGAIQRVARGRGLKNWTWAIPHEPPGQRLELRAKTPNGLEIREAPLWGSRPASPRLVSR